LTEGDQAADGTRVDRAVSHRLLAIRAPAMMAAICWYHGVDSGDVVGFVRLS
jgi:hypothetical protein